MMTRLQYLLLKLGEEASEISQIASKTSQFGLPEMRRDQPLTNEERCHMEIDDLNGIIKMLNEEFNFGYEPDPIRMEEKKVKVNKYYGYSKQLGLVE